MAQYVKTPEMWDLSDEDRAKLQPGQWVTCGGGRGRFAGLYGDLRTPWVTHFDGTTVPLSQFQSMTRSCA